MQGEPETEINEQLRKILVVKRYEQPPPAYFDHLPNRIMTRLCAEVERERMPLLQRWWAVIESKPAFAGGFGLLMCGILVGGVLYSENSDAPQFSAAPLQQHMLPLASSSEPLSLWEEPGLRSETVSLWNESGAIDGGSALDSAFSTNPLLEAESPADLFNNYRGTSTPVSYPAGN